MRYDCIIIGSGFSGLAAGIRLAHFGKKICIYEKQSRLGGLNTYYTKKGLEIESGLHAMTNFSPKTGLKSAPLLKLLRQLRIHYDDIALREQKSSIISFPEIYLRFTNEFEIFESEIKNKFPEEIDNFLRLDKYISDKGFNLNAEYVSARNTVNKYIKNPLLKEILFCPIMYYGSASENDMDFSQFAILYNSIFHEGLCRPAPGIHNLLDILKKRFLESGGEIHTSCEIRTINIKNNKVESIEPANSEKLYADAVLSSAGYIETMELCRPKPTGLPDVPCGQLSFVETIVLLDRPASAYGFDETIVFFNDSPHFNYEKPAGCIHTQSGVICCPNNFQFRKDDVPLPSMLRVTMLANHELWAGMDKKEYNSKKEYFTKEILKITGSHTGISDIEGKVRLTDTFTPNTITHYTGHINGAVYGCPWKIKNGRTCIENLFICGTDQGFMGITGAMLSGISMANLHILVRTD